MNTAAIHDKRVWIGGAAVATILIVASSWFLLISPERSSIAQLHSQASDTDLQNSLVAAKNAKLANQSRNLKVLTSKLATAVNSLPPVSGLPAFTREVSAFAQAHKITLTGINIAGVVSSTATTAGTTTSSTDDGTDAGTTTSTPAPTAPSAGAGVGAPAANGQFSISVTLLSQGPLQRQVQFLNSLQNGPRRVLITSNQITAVANSRVASVDAATTMTTQLNVFCSPMSAGQLSELNKLLTAAN